MPAVMPIAWPYGLVFRGHSRNAFVVRCVGFFFFFITLSAGPRRLWRLDRRTPLKASCVLGLHVGVYTRVRVCTRAGHVTREFFVGRCKATLEENSHSHGARPVHLVIATIKWIRTSRLSIKNSLSGCTLASGFVPELVTLPANTSRVTWPIPVQKPLKEVVRSHL